MEARKRTRRGLLAAAVVVGLGFVAAAPAPVRAQEPMPAEQPKADVGPPSSQTPAAAGSLAALKAGGGELGTTFGQRLQSLLGMAALLSICYAISNNRAKIPWRLVAWGLGLQLILGTFILKTDTGEAIFQFANDAISKIISFTGKGSDFVFGSLSSPGGNAGFVFAFFVLPTIIFFSSLMAVLYYLGAMQLVIKAIAWVMQRTMRTSGSETLSCAGNIFVGQTEAPLLVRPFIKGMTQSELMAVMTGGFATVAGGVMAAYVGMLQGYFSDIAGHLLAASVMSAPAALVCAKIMVPEPEPEKSETYGQLRVELPQVDANVIDAAARGASEGLQLALNVAAMLLAFVALIAMFNGGIGWVATQVYPVRMLVFAVLGLLVHGKASGWSLKPEANIARGVIVVASLIAAYFVAGEGMSLQLILGVVLKPLAWLMGTPWEDATKIGSLIGVKTVLNEFVAYLDLASMLQKGELTSPRSVIIATYALCGFSNFSSIAIQIGGIGSLAPERRHDLAKLGLRAMVAGSFACFLTATVAGVLM